MLIRLENRVLAGLAPDDLALLTPSLHVITLPPPPSGPQQQELPRDQVYFPHDGMVSLLAITPDGETIEMASAGRAGCLGPLFASDLQESVLVALGALRAAHIAIGRLQVLLAQSESLRHALGECREALLLQLRQNLACSGLHPVERRLPRWLLESADRLESDIIPTTQETVAQRLGVRRTTVTLLASKLQAIGAIRWGRSRIEILDRARLEAETCTCHRALRARAVAPRVLDMVVPLQRSFRT
jgi:CRP-like cAMP-binding protein